MLNSKNFTNIILIAVATLFLGIAGYFIFMKKSGPIVQQIPIATLNQTSTPVSLTPDETAQWKMYANTRYGFEIKYPDTWQIDTSYWETDSGIDGVEYPYYQYIPFLGISNGGTKRMGLGTVDILNGENYDFNMVADFRKWHDKYMGSNEIKKVEKSKIGQLDVIKTYEADGVNSVGEYVYITRGDLVVFLTHDSADDAQTQSIFDKFISTFKFTK